MALIQCTECGESISKKAKECPKCGHPNTKAAHLSWQSALGYLVVGGVALWFFAGGGWEQQTTKTLTNIHLQVASDALDQYKIAKKQGDPITICVQAGMVSAALLQGKFEDQYIKMKKIEESDCRAAGLR